MTINSQRNWKYALRPVQGAPGASPLDHRGLDYYFDATNIHNLTFFIFGVSLFKVCV